MKQFNLKLAVIGILSCFLAFAVTSPTKAQIVSSGGNSSPSGSSFSSVSIQPVPSKSPAKQEFTVKKGEKRSLTKGGGDVIQVSHGGNDTGYQTWNDAMDALQEGDMVTLLQDIELVWGDDLYNPAFKMPQVACTIQGTRSTTVLKSVSTFMLAAPVIFKNITLNLKELEANGYPVVFDEGITCTNNKMTICGGTSYYEEGVNIKSTSITIKSGTFHEVYGGGFYADVSGDTNVDIQGGTVTSLYGGGLMYCEIGGSTHVTISNNATVGWLYGGGVEAPVAGTANVTIKKGTIDYIYGGGYKEAAICGNTNLVIEDGTFGKVDDFRYNVMGGGNSAPVTGKAKVTINGGTFNCFVTAGGGQNGSTTATCGSTELNITGGTFTKWTYGGGWSSPVLGTATVKVSGNPSLSTLCGGGATTTASCLNTDVSVSANVGGWLFGGGEYGTVENLAKVTISDGTVTGVVCGGGSTTSALCGSTDVNITGGNLGYVYGGGEVGSVTEESHLSISGTPTIIGNVFGGSMDANATVGSTRVEISGGTFIDPEDQTLKGNIFAGGWSCTVTGNTSLVATGGTIGRLYGGCSQGVVNGATYVEVDGATMDGGTYLDQGDPIQNASSIYGGGFGAEGDTEKGKVGSTNIVVKSLGADSKLVDVFGGGHYGSVSGNTDILIENGDFEAVWGSGYTLKGSQETIGGKVGGDVNIRVKGGEIERLGATRGQEENADFPVTGNMFITMEGGTVTRQISSGNHLKGNDYKSCTLTIRNLGSTGQPYSLPHTYAITDLVLDNSVITWLPPEKRVLHAITINTDYPLTISGNGEIIGEQVLLDNFKEGSFPEDVPFLISENLFEATFASFEGYLNKDQSQLKTLPVYRVGDTYRKTSNADNLKTVTITPSDQGKPSVVWKEAGRNTTLQSGDRVPVDTELTLSAIPNAGYEGGYVYVNEEKQENETYQVSDDVTITVGDFTAIPYKVEVLPTANGKVVADPNTDVTVNTPVNLTITPDEGYRLVSGSLKVYKSGDEEMTVTLSGNSFVMPAYNVTVTARFEVIPAPPTPPAPVYYTVTLPTVEGVTTDPAGDDYKVESWDNFGFYLTLDKEYDQSKPVVTTSRGETIEPRSSDGKYVIRYVRSDLEIYIDGIGKNPAPVANETIETETVEVWGGEGYLYLRLGMKQKVYVYTFTGSLVRHEETAAGDSRWTLPDGNYIVRIGNRTYKVAVR